MGPKPVRIRRIYLGYGQSCKKNGLLVGDTDLPESGRAEGPSHRGCVLNCSVVASETSVELFTTRLRELVIVRVVTNPAQ
jgi:hypothetical protein